MQWLHNTIVHIVAYIRRIPKTVRMTVLAVFGVIAVVGFSISYLTTPPDSFPRNQAVSIEKGLSASEVADSLKAQGVVRSSDILYLAIILFHDPSGIKAGSFAFREPLTVFEVARRITDDNPELEYVSLTFYEGMTAEGYAEIAERYLIDFDAEYFVNRGRSFEGFLFPETYYLPYEFTADDLLTLLNDTYQAETEELFRNNPTNLSEYEIVTMASLLEREGNEEENMRMIAGIMFNRLELNMPLQLDASIEYVLNKSIDMLTPDDLTIDTPYNTYLNRGLPPTPIGNPGVQAIRAILNPIESDYLYYITGNDGNFYYAETYDEHLDNIERYLR